MNDRIPGTEGMHCAIGLFQGSRTLTMSNGIHKRGHAVHGVFGLRDPDGMFGPPNVCTNPPRFWCMFEGQWGWLACDLPDHQRGAEAVTYLTPEIVAFLVWQQNPYQPLPPFLQNVRMLNPLHATRAKALSDEMKNAARLGAAVGGAIAGFLSASKEVERTCEFCGCMTNAKLRRCCAKGQAADRGIPRNKGSKAKKRATKLLKG